jgi:hypothetical protein
LLSNISLSQPEPFLNDVQHIYSIPRSLPSQELSAQTIVRPFSVASCWLHTFSSVRRDNARKSAPADFEHTTHPARERPCPDAHRPHAYGCTALIALALISLPCRSFRLPCRSLSDKRPALARAARKIYMRALARAPVNPHHCPNLDSAYMRAMWY